ncbi:MAG: AI-2E family transporter [Planctomycetaceae bacterium]|nr:AI-2E family transporter [Planctomycetaceae bacterium]
MSERISLWTLVAVAAAVGLLFFQVIRPFLIPVLFATVLAILVRPLCEQLAGALNGQRRIAAGITAVVVILLVLLPISVAVFIVGRELVEFGQTVRSQDLTVPPALSRWTGHLQDHLTDAQWEHTRSSVESVLKEGPKLLYQQTGDLLTNLVRFVVALAVMGLALYYFLAEGQQMVESVHEMSPLADEDERTLFVEFERICRGVVLATVVTALFQATMAGIGFALAGVGHVWLLAGLTMFTAMIPFLGAGSIWVTVSLWLLWNGETGRAVFLIVYGSLLVSSLDNLIRAKVIEGSANLHPLLGVISMLGALRLIGLWGVFVGPMVAAFFYAVLRILRERHERQLHMAKHSPAVSGRVTGHVASPATGPYGIS